MTAGCRGSPGRALGDALLRAAVPDHGHRRVSDRRWILVGDAESQSLHALRVVWYGAGFEVDATRSAAQALDHGSATA
jgi:hypothetical protein